MKLADSTGRTALHLACVSGWADLARWLVDDLALDPAAANAEGMGAVHFAALGGNLEVIEWLSSLGVSLSAATGSGMTALHLASMKGHLEVAQYLVALRGAADSAAAAAAASSANSGEAGADAAASAPLFDPKAGDARKRTPLHLAVVGSHDAVVRWLLDTCGADPKAGDADNKTPVALATTFAAAPNAPPGAARVKELLAAALAVPPPPSAPVPMTAEEVASSKQADATETPAGEGGEGAAPAATAATAAAATAAPTAHDRAWLRWEAPHQPPAGLPVLAYSVQAAPKWGMSGFKDVQLLLSASSSPTAAAPAEDGAPAAESGESASAAAGTGAGTAATTSLASACVVGLSPATTYTFRVRARNANGWGQFGAASKEVSTLAAPGSDASSSSSSGSASTPAKQPGAGGGDADGGADRTPGPPPAPAFTPTLSARAAECAAKGDVEGLTAAADAGEDVTGVDAGARTVLHHGASGGHVEVCRWALARDIAVDVRDRIGATPLLLAVVNGHLPILKFLSSQGASVDAADLKGYTALQYAAMKARVAVFRWLCEAGADPGARNSKGQACRDILDAKLAVQPPPSEEEARSFRYMLAAAAAAENLPVPPPAPVFVDSTRFVVYVQLPPAKWTPGNPAPYAYEVQYGKKGLSLFWTTASDVVPPGINIFADDYLVAKPTAAQAQAQAADGAGDGGKEDGGKEDGAGGSSAGAAAAANAAASKPATGSLASGAFLATVHFALTGLSPDSKYVAQVRAKNARGWGPWSAKSGDMVTKPATDKHQVSADLQDSAHATQVACNEVLVDLRAASAAGRKVGPSIVLVPIRAAASAGKASAEGAGGGGSEAKGKAGSATAGSTPVAASSTAASSSRRRDSAGSTASAGYDAAVAEAGEGEGAGGENPLLAAAEAGALETLKEHAGLRDVRAALVAALAAHAPKGAAAAAEQPFEAVVAAWTRAGDAAGVASSSFDAPSLRDGGVGGEALSPTRLYARLAAAAAHGARLHVLRWLAGAADAEAAGAGALRSLSLALVSEGAGDGRGLLHAAALGGSVEVLELLARAVGGDGEAPAAAALRQRTRTGATPLHFALFAGHVAAAKWLLQGAGAGAARQGLLTAPDTAHGWGPAHYAAAGGSAEALELLLQEEVQNGGGGGGGAAALLSSAVDARGAGVAHVAAAADALAVLALLERLHPAALTARDGAGQGALHYAAAADAGAGAAYLLASPAAGRACLRAKDAAGRTAEDVAYESGAVCVQSVLRAWNARRGGLELPPAHVVAHRAGPTRVHVSWAGPARTLALAVSGATGVDPAAVGRVLGPLVEASTSASGGYEVQWVCCGGGGGVSPVLFAGPGAQTVAVDGVGNGEATVTKAVDGVPGGSVAFRVRGRRGGGGGWGPWSVPVLVSA